MKKLFSILFSLQFTTVLIVVFALAMGAATFIENDFGTPTARKLVFDATWFEMVIALLGVNFLGNIRRYKLWQWSKAPVLTFHLALVLIVLGAGISRLTSFEGVMHIREGQESSTIVTDKTYLQIRALNNPGDVYEKELLLTSIGSNDFGANVEVGGEKFSVKYAGFIPKAVEVYEESDHGEAVISIMASTGGGNSGVFYISLGSTVNIMGVEMSYGNKSSGEIQIEKSTEGLSIRPHHDLMFMKMADQSRGVVPQDSAGVLEKGKLYIHGHMSFALESVLERASKKIISSEKEADKYNADILVVKVRNGDQEQEVMLPGKKGEISRPQKVKINKTELLVSYGSKGLKTPFSIHLNDFQLERYPGSRSPASYASEVEVIDEDEDTRFPFRVYMNNVLDYKGYRFFQASYDNDELGTVLSVNHDFWGTLVTYIGYGLMMLGMVLNMFWKGTRFKKLTQSLKDSKVVAGVVVLLLLSSSIDSLASSEDAPSLDSLINTQNIDKEHAHRFGALLLQDEGGRVKPVNTMASEVLRKLYKKNNYRGLDANQVFLGMHSAPSTWAYIPIITVTKGRVNLKPFLDIDGKYGRYVDFFDNEGNFLLAEDTEQAMQKREAERNDSDKLLIAVSQRVTLMYELFSGKLLRIFPLPDDATQKWYSYSDRSVGFKDEDSVFVYYMPRVYFNDVKDAMQSETWEEAGEKLIYFDKYQQRYGKAVMPSEGKVKMELLYNDLEIFNKLYKYYGLVGFVMLVLLLLNIFNERHWTKSLVIVSAGGIVLLFVMHTMGLAARWYVSGHAPWSNAYESIIYVAWSTVLAGLLFIRRSKITLSATAIMASIFLMVAHWNWVDPEINNLMPVLNSYWLIIHVAIIVASYGPFTLAFLLGIICLVLFTLQNNNNKLKIGEHISRLTKVNELVITIGVFLLAIGTFLGGVWANESWGRYWSWDPKETWALISVMIYAFVLHMRLIPGLKGSFAFNLAAILSYSSIMMTYFGVNYYLAGMHSYAKGDPVPVPEGVYYTVAIVVLLAVVAYWRKTRVVEKG